MTLRKKNESEGYTPDSEILLLYILYHIFLKMTTHG